MRQVGIAWREGDEGATRTELALLAAEATLGLDVPASADRPGAADEDRGGAGRVGTDELNGSFAGGTEARWGYRRSPDDPRQREADRGANALTEAVPRSRRKVTPRARAEDATKPVGAGGAAGREAVRADCRFLFTACGSVRSGATAPFVQPGALLKTVEAVGIEPTSAIA